MYTIVKNENGVITAARIVPKGCIVLQFWNRITYVIRRDDIVRVTIAVGPGVALDSADTKKNGGHIRGPSDVCGLEWTTRAGQDLSVELPAFAWALDTDGGSAKYVAAAVYDSIVYGSDDVVWFEQEPSNDRYVRLWRAVGNDVDHQRDWPELVLEAMP